MWSGENSDKNIMPGALPLTKSNSMVGACVAQRKVRYEGLS
jgi:hypothetical protein